jgi:hypothetical protein
MHADVHSESKMATEDAVRIRFTPALRVMGDRDLEWRADGIQNGGKIHLARNTREVEEGWN